MSLSFGLISMRVRCRGDFIVETSGHGGDEEKIKRNKEEVEMHWCVRYNIDDKINFDFS